MLRTGARSMFPLGFGGHFLLATGLRGLAGFYMPCSVLHNDHFCPLVVYHYYSDSYPPFMYYSLPRYCLELALYHSRVNTKKRKPIIKSPTHQKTRNNHAEYYLQPRGELL